jgi:hypothetical protein
MGFGHIGTKIVELISPFINGYIGFGYVGFIAVVIKFYILYSLLYLT